MHQLPHQAPRVQYRHGTDAIRRRGTMGAGPLTPGAGSARARPDRPGRLLMSASRWGGRTRPPSPRSSPGSTTRRGATGSSIRHRPARRPATRPSDVPGLCEATLRQATVFIANPDSPQSLAAALRAATLAYELRAASAMRSGSLPRPSRPSKRTRRARRSQGRATAARRPPPRPRCWRLPRPSCVSALEDARPVRSGARRQSPLPCYPKEEKHRV